MREPDVLRHTHRFLHAQGLAGHRVLDLYTDAHPSLVGETSLQPFQRFTLALEGFTVHPDLVGRLDDGETTFAIEAKGTDDLLRGLAQATTYRFGFHLALLVAAGPIAADLILLARQQQVGILAVQQDIVSVLSLPAPHLPQRRHAGTVQQQFATTEAVASTFLFNLPTHYLSLAVGLRESAQQSRSALEARLRAVYPVLPSGPTSFAAVLRGTQKLGLVATRGDMVERTLIGEAAGRLLPSLHELAAVHEQLVRQRGLTLDVLSPPSAAVLRWLLAADPIAQLIVATLHDLRHPVSMPDLARAALARDKVQAMIAFFNPETIGGIMDPYGRIDWANVTPQHYRSTTSYQYKSLLKHAGLITARRLGGSTTNDYNPDADLWELGAYG